MTAMAFVCTAIPAYIFLFGFNLRQLRNLWAKWALSLILALLLSANLFIILSGWHGLPTLKISYHNLLMFWLGYPEYSYTIMMGIVSALYYVSPVPAGFDGKLKLSLNTVVLVSFAAHARIFFKGWNSAFPDANADLIYQSMHASFLGAACILMLFLIHILRKMSS